jgi:hypothetical protein
MHERSTRPWRSVAEASCSPEAYSEKGKARIRDALQYLSADEEGEWFYRAAEIQSLNWGETGYEILDDWSKTTRADNYNPSINRKRWDELKANHKNKRTIGSLFYEAQKNGWDEAAFEQAWKIQSLAQQGNQPTVDLKIFRGDELLSTPAPPRRWLVESWIPAAETTMLDATKKAMQAASVFRIRLSRGIVPASKMLGVSASNLLAHIVLHLRRAGTGQSGKVSETVNYRV